MRVNATGGSSIFNEDSHMSAGNKSATTHACFPGSAPAAVESLTIPSTPTIDATLLPAPPPIYTLSVPSTTPAKRTVDNPPAAPSTTLLLLGGTRVRASR
jgi:hypothetical protein